jgi:RhoGAP domain
VYEEEVPLSLLAVPSVAKAITSKLEKADKKGGSLGSVGRLGGASLRHRLRNRPVSGQVDANATALETTHKLFGAPLHEVLAQEQEIRPDAALPRFIEQIVNHVLLKGLDQEGIFRISGQKGEMEQMEADINAGRPLVIDRDTTNVHNLTGLLKKYLRDLPQPLCTPGLYERFLEVQRQFPQDEQKEACFEALKELFTELPKENFRMLEAIFRMTYHVQNSSEVNKMTANNLGVVFGPNILYSKGGDDVASLTNAEDVKNVTARMCEGYETIFHDYLAEREANDPSPLHVRKRLVAHARSVQNLLCANHSNAPDCEQTLITTSNNIIAMWDPFTGTKKAEIDLEDYIFSVDDDKKGFVWVACEKAVHIISLADLAVAKVISDRGGGSCITHVNTEMWLNSMTENHISAFHASKQEFFRQLPGHEEGVGPMRLLDDGKVWGATLKSTVIVIDIRTGQILAQAKGIHHRKVTTMCRVGEHVCIGGEDGVLSFFNAESMKYERKLEAHDGNVKNVVAWEGDLWSCSWDMAIRVWDTTSLRLKHEFIGKHSDGVSGLVFLQDPAKEWWMWSSSFDRCIMLYKAVPSSDRTETTELVVASAAPVAGAGRGRGRGAPKRGAPVGAGPKRGAARGVPPGPGRGAPPAGLAAALANRQNM